MSQRITRFIYQRFGQPFTCHWPKFAAMAAACLVFMTTYSFAQVPIPKYNGGDLVPNPELVVVYWGDLASPSAAQLDTFYNRISRSHYFDTLAEYATPRRGSLLVSYKASFGLNSGVTQTVGTVQIARELDTRILKGELPFPLENTIYVVHFGPKVSTIIGTTIFGAKLGAPPMPGTGGYCAYHFSARTHVPTPIPGVFVFGPKIRIAVIPDQVSTSCAGGSSPSLALDATTSIATHEIVETITNPDSVIIEMAPITGAAVQCNGIFFPVDAVPVPPFSGPFPPQPFLNGASRWAWTTSKSALCNPDEIADSCSSAANFQTTPASTTPIPNDGLYSVSQIFSLAKGACAVSAMQGTVTSPPPVSAHDLCLAGCARDLTACKVIAHSFAERNQCFGEASSCRSDCP